MLNQELNELDAHLKQLDHSLQEVYCIIDQILSDPAKDFSLTFKNYGFKIFNPIDLKEFGQVEKNKQKYCIKCAAERQRYHYPFLSPEKKRNTAKLLSGG